MERDRKHVLSHAAIYLAARGLPGVVAFFAIPVFTRLLNPDEYGRYALVVASVTMLNALLFQWLRLSLVRYLPAYQENSAQFKSTLAGTTLAMIAGLGILAGGICLFPIGGAWRWVIVACWGMLAIQALFELCCEYARSMLRPRRYMVLQMTKSLGAILLGMGLVLIGWGWWGPLVATMIGMGAAVVWCYRRDWSDVRLSIDGAALKKVCVYGIPLSIDGAALKKVCVYGIPLSLTVALVNVIGSTDRYLLAWFSGEGTAGLYSVAVDFTERTLTLLMLVINMAVFPLAVRAWENQGREAAVAQMRSNASLLMVVGVPCVVGMAILAPGIAHCFLGRHFSEAAAHIIPLVALGAFLANFKAFHFDAAFQFAHRTIYQVWIVLFVAIVNVGLNWVAIPRWGINGAMGASVLAYAISIVLTAWIGRRQFALPFPFAEAGRVLLAAGLMAAALFPWRGNLGGLALTGQIVMGAVVYGVILAASNFMGMRQAMMRKLGRRDARITNLADVTGPVAAESGRPEARTTNSAAQLVEVQ